MPCHLALAVVFVSEYARQGQVYTHVEGNELDPVAFKSLHRIMEIYIVRSAHLRYGGLCPVSGLLVFNDDL